MNQEPNHTDPPQVPAEEPDRDLHRALSDLEMLINGANAENIRQNRDKASGNAFDNHAFVEDEERERVVLPDTNSEAFQSLVRQLTDEIEIIVQSRVDAALGGVTKDITHQLKTHLNIMLPAFLDNLANLAFRGDE